MSIFWYLVYKLSVFNHFDYVIVFSLSLFTAFLLTHKSSQNFYFFLLIVFLYFSFCDWTWERPQFVANLVILANICFNISDILFSICLAQESFEVNCIRHRTSKPFNKSDSLRVLCLYGLFMVYKSCFSNFLWITSTLYILFLHNTLTTLYPTCIWLFCT